MGLQYAKPVYASASIPVNSAFSNEPVEVSREEIEAALRLHNGVIARVAKSLGLSRQALYRRMDKFGLARE
jgi:transcriptional regulator of acetoin/glycerol metabolism